MTGKNTGPGDGNISPGFDGGDESYEKTLVFEDAGAMEEGAFEFAAFAQSEADAAALARQQHAVSPLPAPRGPERRPVVRRSYLPPGDVVVDARPVGGMTVVSLRGRVNESFRGLELGRSLSGEVVFDLSEVERVSSFGVKGWLQMLEASRMTRCYFFRCSEAIVNQITMMRNFCGPGHIHSLTVPYTCGHCGEEFGALYEAVADREYIQGRSPAEVECPGCGQAAEMDDDPWSYFALDDHLLHTVPNELQQVVDHLTSTNRVDPIEKFISETETRVRFNADIDGRLRLRRAFAGLEGRVTLDMSVTPSVDQAGLERLVSGLRELDPEVSEVWLDGAIPPLIRALLNDPIPRVYVSSMFVQARCVANRITRPILIDVDRRRDVLKAHRLPPVDANWAVGPVDVADTDLLFQAAEHLGPPQQPQVAHAPYSQAHQVQGDPYGIQGDPYGTQGAFAGPSYGGGPSHGGFHAPSSGTGSLPPYAQPPTSTRHPMPSQLNHPQGMPGGTAMNTSSTSLMWQGAAAIAVAALFTAMVVLCAVVYILVKNTNPVATEGVAPEAAQILPIAVGADQGWDNGSALPPVWSEQAFVATATDVKFVGKASATSLEEATQQAQVDATYGLLLRLRAEVASMPSGDALSDIPPDIAPDVVVARFLGDVGDWVAPTLETAATHRAETLTVLSQHSLPRDVWDRLVNHYGSSKTFRGLAVGNRFPTDYGASSHLSTPLVITQAASWFRSAKASDGVISVEGIPVTTPDAYVQVAKDAWNDLSGGERMEVQLHHNGRPTQVAFIRQAPSAPSPSSPPSLELLPMDGN